jgi:hypothetical protein
MEQIKNKNQSPRYLKLKKACYVGLMLGLATSCGHQQGVQQRPSTLEKIQDQDMLPPAEQREEESPNLINEPGGTWAKGEIIDRGECHGINSCRGLSECGGVGHSCSGKNTCKSLGWVKLTRQECETEGGEYQE